MPTAGQVLAPGLQRPGGVSWWAQLFSRIAVSLHKMSTAMAAIDGDLGTITATHKKMVAALVGQQAQSGAQAAALKQLQAALAAQEIESGNLSALLPALVGAAVGDQTQAGTISVIAKKMTASLPGVMEPAGAVAAALDQMSAALAGEEAPQGDIVSTLFPMAAILAGIPIEAGGVTSSLLPLSVSLNGEQTQQGAMGASLFKMSPALLGEQTQSGAIVSAFHQSSASLLGVEQPQGIIATTLKQAAAAISGQHAQSGSLAGALRKMSASLTGVELETGTIAASLKQALATLSGTMVQTGPGFVSGASAEATSIATMPSHQSGDVLLMFAFRDGSNTLPTLPSGWTQIDSVGVNTCSGRLAYKVAASSSEVSGTWTSATELVCQVYRGALGSSFSVVHGTGSSATVNYPALTLGDTGGQSLVAAFGGHRSINGTMGNAPTGMTQRVNQEGATADAAGFDTGGGVTSWSSQNVSSGETASGYITFVVEIVSANTTAVLPDNSASSAYQTALSSGTAFTFTQPNSTAGAYAIVGIYEAGNSTMNSPTALTVQFGTATLTQIGSIVNNGGNANTYGWNATFGGYIIGSGPQTVSITPTQSGKAFYGWGASFTYINVTSVGSLQSATGVSTSPALTATSADGHLLWGSVCPQAGGQPASFSLTTRQLQYIGGNTPAAIEGDIPGAASVTVSATCSPSTGWSAVAVDLS